MVDRQQRKLCFIIGPMNDMDRFNRLAYDIIQPIMRPLGYDVETPYQDDQGRIMYHVMAMLDRADIVIADVTDVNHTRDNDGRFVSSANPNVLYELGVRHSLGLPYIIVTETPDNVPFDIRHLRFTQIRIQDVAMSKGALATVLQRADQNLGNDDVIDNPVTNFYTVPLTEVSPATGLALGYYRNFVAHTILDLTQTRDFELWVGDELVEGPDRSGVKVDLIIPKRLSQTITDNIRANLVDAGHLLKATIERQPRSIGLYARPHKVNGFYRLVDIPTTMNVMHESIDQRFPGTRLNRESSAWLALEQQEIERFAAQLRRLHHNEMNSLIKTRINIAEWDFPDT